MVGEDAFSAGPPITANIVNPTRLIYVSPKKPRNKLLLAAHVYYFIFKTFFS